MMDPEFRIPFLKMEGTGNDFILIDNREDWLSTEEGDWIAALCRRRKGIGADGLILLEKGKNHTLRMRYFNADGLEASMCGNGARCVAHAIISEKWQEGPVFTFESREAVHRVQVGPNSVRLEMPRPHWVQREMDLRLENDLQNWGWVQAGVPHVGILCNDTQAVDVNEKGAQIRHQTLFPQGVNVNFIQWISSSRLRVRTFERGVEAETLSCGTGAVASAFMAHSRRDAVSPLTIETRGGILTVYFQEDWQETWLEGEVRLVYRGSIPASAVREK